MDSYLLTLLTFLPLAGGLALLFVPQALARWGAFAISALTFVLSLGLWTGFDRGAGALQFEQRATWIEAWGVNYHVGVDGLSVLLVLLTTFLMPMVILGSFTYIKKHVQGYMALCLMLQGFMTGAFVAVDLFLFYVYWELMLIPIYLIVGIWGGQNRIYAAIKLFVYTMVGSLLMLGAILSLYYMHHEQFGTWSAYMHDLYKVNVPLGAQSWMFLCFALAFAIKMPMWPLHTWLPDAHTEAPTGGSMVLAGILLKMGTYGFIRLAMPLFPEAALQYAPAIMTLSVIGIVVGALVAMVQSDVKKLVAYSSVSHLGFVSLGLFTFNIQGTNGAMMQMINHGLSTPALFLIVGILYERRHTRLIRDYGGIAKVIPITTFFFMLFTFSSIGLPGLNGFIGEFLVLLGTFAASPWMAFLAGTAVIFGATYMLWMFQRVMFGPLRHEENKKIADLSGRELLAVIPLAAACVALGVYPGPLLDTMKPTVDSYVSAMRTRLKLPKDESGLALRADEASEAVAVTVTATATDATEATAWVSAGEHSALGNEPFEETTLSNLAQFADQITGQSFYLIGPVVIYTVLAFISLMWGAVQPVKAARGSLWLGLAGALLSLGLVAAQWTELSGAGVSVFGDMAVVDRFSLFFTGLASAIVILVLLLSRDYLEREEIHVGEFYTLLFFCVVGVLLMGMSNDLMLLFIAVELMSLAAYVLTGFNRGSFTCIEGALKYFILGSFASAFLLFGIALIYGATGTTNVSAIGDLFGHVTSLKAATAKLSADPRLTPEVLPIGVGLLLIGLAFKIGAAPFHMWVPDVYQGAPAPVTAFMSTAIKAAAFSAFVRILVVGIPGLESLWAPLVVAIAALTMIVGNVAALVQRDVKRMLAYSSIAHGGYAMMGFLAINAAGGSEAVGAILTYLIAYAAMNIGAFAVLVLLQNKIDLEVTDLDSFGGLGFKYPLLAIAMTVFMISLGGLPPTAGFIAKFGLFSAVVEAGYGWLVILALVTSMASMYYYLRVVVYMYMRPEYGSVTLRDTMLPGVVVGVTALAVILIGLFPSTGPVQLLQWARDSVQALL